MDIDNQLTIARQHLATAQGDTEITLDGAILPLSHLSKELWPATPASPVITKRQLIDYYLKVADILLPHLKDRPITFKRFPDGIAEQGIMQRHFDEVPDFVHQVEICVDDTGTNQPFVVCQNAATLIWLANLGTIEFHPWNSRVNPEDTKLPTIFINSVGTLEMSVLNYPDWLVIDIDPSSISQSDIGQLFDQAKRAATQIYQHLNRYQLNSQLKLSGQGGLHIFIPLKRLYTFDQVRQTARTLCQQLAEEHNLFTTEWNVERRAGRIFLDWQQNARSKSLAAPYSLRATSMATVSMPIDWSELDNVQPDQFTLQSIPANPTDAWADIQSQGQELPAELL
jgi:bifunctional non-homologous end joining protein LigD